MARQQLWRSLGRVHVARGETSWHTTHASYPTPLPLPDGSVRVFFSPRDTEGRSSIFSLDLALSPSGFEILGTPRGPWLEPGPAGAFDDAGVSVAWVGHTADGGLDCWYLGWTLGVSVPFRTAIGRATAVPGSSRMERTSHAPVLDRSRTDPLSLSYPWLIPRAEGLTAWYGTHLHPPRGGRTVDHVLRRAISHDDGVTWRRDDVPALDHGSPDEWALSRPSVLNDGGDWHMWFCRRLPAYRLGYACSPDGRIWTRADAGLHFAGPEEDWETGGRCYPAVFDHAGRRWMLYCGTGYGRSGFGVALLEG